MDCSHIQFCIHESITSGVAPDVAPGIAAEIDLQQLQALFQVTAFWAQDRQPEDWKIALANSKPIVTVWDSIGAAASAQPQLIGFARATSDGIYRATIWDVAIHPDYQGLGLGRKLVETVLMHPHVNRVERVYLMTTNQQEFYRRIGFEENRSTTMVLCNQAISQEGLPISIELLSREAAVSPKHHR